MRLSTVLLGMLLSGSGGGSSTGGISSIGGYTGPVTLGNGLEISSSGVLSWNGIQFSVEVVDTLPATGELNVIYLVPVSGETYYEEYLWVNNAFELIGTTQIDLSGYYAKTDVDELPTNNSDNVIKSTDILATLVGGISVIVTSGSTITDQGLKNRIDRRLPIAVNNQLFYYMQTSESVVYYVSSILDGTELKSRLLAVDSSYVATITSYRIPQNMHTELWTFTLADGTIVTRNVVIT